MTIIWCMLSEIGAWQTDFFVILDCFLHFYPLTTLKIKILKQWKKSPGDIIILHSCTINDNHMMYGPWDIEHNEQNFLSFWSIFYCFTPLTTQKIKILKNWNGKSRDIIILHKCSKNHDHMLYFSWDMARNRCNYFSFWTIFCTFTPLTGQKIKIKKKRKKILEISSEVYQKSWSYVVLFLWYGVWQV